MKDDRTPEDANDILRKNGEEELRRKSDKQREKPKAKEEAPPHTEVPPGPGVNGAGAGNVEAAPKVQLLGWRDYRKLNGAKGSTFLIKGLVRVGTLISINGRPSGGKSAVAIEIARVLDNEGEEFLGRETKRCVTLYIASEDQDDIANRLEALELDNVLIVVAEEGVPLMRPDKAVAVIREAIRLAREKFPDREIFIPLDTLRAGLGGQSVLDDRFTAPALHALRKLAEEEQVVIAVINHTNRENPKQTKGETLESVSALEFVLVDGDGDWFELHVGKNRSGPARRQIGRVRFTSIPVREVDASIVDQIEAAEGGGGERPRKLGGNQALIMTLMRQAIDNHHGVQFRPFHDGPTVTAVKEKHLLETFIQRKPGDDRASKRRGFDAAILALANVHLVRGENAEGEGVIWFARKADETGKKQLFSYGDFEG